MEHEDEDPIGSLARDLGRICLMLVPALILLAAIASSYPDLREGWALGGPGARHAEDVVPELREAWAR